MGQTDNRDEVLSQYTVPSPELDASEQSVLESGRPGRSKVKQALKTSDLSSQPRDANKTEQTAENQEHGNNSKKASPQHSNSDVKSKRSSVAPENPQAEIPQSELTPEEIEVSIYISF